MFLLAAVSVYRWGAATAASIVDCRNTLVTLTYKCITSQSEGRERRGMCEHTFHAADGVEWVKSGWVIVCVGAHCRQQPARRVREQLRWDIYCVYKSTFLFPPLGTRYMPLPLRRGVFMRK